jgi:hypothetical protein
MVTNRILAAAALVLVSTAPSFAKYGHPGIADPPILQTTPAMVPSPLSTDDQQAAPEKRAPTPASTVSVPSSTFGSTRAPLHDHAGEHEEG